MALCSCTVVLYNTQILHPELAETSCFLPLLLFLLLLLPLPLLLLLPLELPWDAPTSECAEFREWCAQNYFFPPWTKISNEPLGKYEPLCWQWLAVDGTHRPYLAVEANISSNFILSHPSLFHLFCCLSTRSN